MVDTGIAVRMGHGLGKCCAVLALATAFSTVQPVMAPGWLTAQAQTSAVFSRIDVAGNQRINADTIRTIAGIAPGTRVSPAQINDALQNLYASGLFETVDVRPERGRLVIEVVENPTINRVSIEGNRRIKDDVLLPLVGSQPRRAYSPNQAEADVEAITLAYAQAGRLAARVTPKIIKRSDNRVDLVFEVQEGRTVEVNRIGFTGNRVYSDRRLRRTLETKQAGLFRTLVRRDTYIQDRVEFDKQKILEFYNKRGYIDAEVISSAADFSRERNSFLLNFKIQEGQQYNFGEMNITSLEPDVNVEDYDTALKINPGRPFDARKVETTLERMDVIAYNAGLPFVRAIPRVTRNDETRTIDIEFELQRGDRIFVERIDIEGNSTTLDRVIRRQFRVVEGDPFNPREIRQAADRIRALGYFADVQIESRQGSGSDQAVIDVNVEEQSTGSLGFGVGYGTDDGLSGTITLTENNLLGRGQSVSLSLTTSGEDRNFDFSFTEPALYDRDLLAGVGIFYRTSNSSFTNYDTTALGIAPRIAFPISENARLQLSYSIARNKVDNVPATASPLLNIEQKSFYTSEFGVRYTLDRRNSPIDPTAGFILSLDNRIAGSSGNRSYFKAVANAKAYRSFLNEEFIVSAEVEGGFLNSFGGNSSIVERFHMGGNTLRGFESFGIGPRDVTGGLDDALGGKYYALARFEASFPIGLPEEYGIHGGIFFDVGSLWGLDVTSSGGSTVDDSSKIRSAIGVSIFWDTVIGPLRFNFAKPLDSVAGVDKTQRFNFTIDTRF